MKKITEIILITIFIVVFAPFTYCEDKKESPISFSAETELNIKGEITKGRIYLKGSVYRYDMLVDKKRKSTVEDKIKTEPMDLTVITTLEVKNISTIVDKSSKKAIILDHDEKSYLEIPVTYLTNPKDFNAFYLLDPLYLNNPIEAHYAMSKIYKVIEKGEEKIEGLNCRKKELRDENILIQIAWISEKYGIPLKLVNYIQDKEHTKFEVKNIKEEIVKEELFRIPEGYKRGDLD